MTTGTRSLAVHPPHVVPADRARGQALVEFSLVLIPFLFIMLGILDMGRGIYVYNGAAEAAREIARVTSVQPGSCPAGSTSMPSTCWSPQMQAVVATQKSLVPGLTTSDITISCTDLTGAPQDASQCYVGTGGAGQVRFVEVQVSVPFSIVAFNFLPVQPTFTFTAVSHVQMS